MFQIMALFIAHPWLAIPVAAVCAALWSWRRRTSAGLASVAWTLYAAYEYLVLTRVLCSGECNIRIDLLLIFPVLVVLTAMALFSSIRNADPGTRYSG